MPSPTLHRLLSALIAALVLIPTSAVAYFSPEEVLLSQEFFLPPSKRESQDRMERQRELSTERRTREQEESFSIQHAAAPEEIPEEEFVEEEPTEEGLVLPAGLSSTDLELLRTIRLLDRITDRQRTLQYGMTVDGQPLHGGAPPLAPTGAGAWLAATTIIGAIGWTIRKARNSETKAFTR